MIRVALLGLVLLASFVRAEDTRPPLLRESGIDPRLGETVPLDLELRDESGTTVRLGDYLGKRPVVLTPVYYECPMLCSVVLNGFVATLRTLSLDLGKDFDVVTFSIDPAETPELAAERKRTYAARYARPGVAEGWHFLTGDEEAVRRLTEAIGFRYAYDSKLDQYAHAAVILVLTPEGRIARYFYGVEFPARDVRLGLVEASENRIGTLTDQLLLFCFHYDPATGKYGPIALGSVRVGGLLTVLGLGSFLFVMWRRERGGAVR